MRKKTTVARWSYDSTGYFSVSFEFYWSPFDISNDFYNHYWQFIDIMQLGSWYHSKRRSLRIFDFLLVLGKSSFENDFFFKIVSGRARVLWLALGVSFVKSTHNRTILFQANLLIGYFSNYHRSQSFAWWKNELSKNQVFESIFG